MQLPWSGVKNHDNISLQLRFISSAKYVLRLGLCISLLFHIEETVNNLRVESSRCISYSVYSPRVVVDIGERLGLMQGEP